MAREDINFYEYGDGSYYMFDLFLYDRYFLYKNSYNYYDIDVDKILVYKNNNNEYVIRYNDVHNDVHCN